MTWLVDNHPHSSDRLTRGMKFSAKLKPLPFTYIFAVPELVTFSKLRIDTDVNKRPKQSI